MAFHFKEFSVDDSACAMKVGTDSVLLGAWADFAAGTNILDIGTGCGLLALMAAQECHAAITAIDIDVDCCRQAEKNFSESPWSERLQCIAQGLEEFTVNRLASRGESDDHLADSFGHLVGSGYHLADAFDHIITNPPYFINSLKSPSKGRNTARHNDGLPLKSLVEYSSLLLKDSGKLSVVFPFADSPLLISLAKEHGLIPVRQCLIIPKEGKEPNRILLEITKRSVEKVVTETLVIRDNHGNYTQEYISLTDRFYLKLS